MARQRWDNTQSVYSGFLRSGTDNIAATAAPKDEREDLEDWLLSFAQSRYATVADALDASGSTLARLLNALSQLREAHLVEIAPTTGLIKVTDLGQQVFDRRR
jgi:hypothetical protein